MATNLDGFKKRLDKFLEEKATSPDGGVLSPVSLCAPVAGEHGWEGAVASCPACSSLAAGWLAYV